MSFSINRVTLKGNLGKDPEIRALQGGGDVATFSLATSEDWKDKATGEKRERTDWHNVVVWPKWMVDVCRSLKKGDTVLIEGQLQTRSYEDQAGQKRYVTEVVLNGFNAVIDKIERGGGGRAPAPNSRDDYGSKTGGASAAGGSQSSGAPRDLDDEIPF